MSFSRYNSHLAKFQESNIDDAKNRASHVVRMPYAVVKNGKILGAWGTEHAAMRFALMVGGEVKLRKNIKPHTLTSVDVRES